MITRFLLLAAAIFIGLLPTTASAQTYPSMPIKLILPYNPSGIIDYVGRVLGQQVSDLLGQTVVPENRPGAGGIVGTDVVARSRPDGYTLLLMDPAIVINPTLHEHVPYDLFKQLEIISVVSSSPVVLVVPPQLNVKTFTDFVAYAKANPGKLNFASAGIGTAPHLTGELFKQRTGIDATHVPYKGIGGSFTDLMANKVQFAFSSIAGALPFTSSNQLLPLATTGERRSPVYPDVPTIQQAGINDFTVDLWIAVFAPAGLPADVRGKLNGAIRTALQNPDLKAAFAKIGAELRGTSPEEGTDFVKASFESWKGVIEDAKIKIN
jgi:tripartite-type tricarboxylate transporter receptor subunit TctC